tara:strand:- start:350 stop:508 length:159 start_codon:yes stop_codon:yes gene_type:complete
LKNHDWAIDRIHTLCEENIDDAYAICCEFKEWLNPEINEHDVVSLEYIGDTE